MKTTTGSMATFGKKYRRNMFNYSIIWQKEGNIHDGCNEINPDVVDISTIRRNFAGVHSCTRT